MKKMTNGQRKLYDIATSLMPDDATYIVVHKRRSSPITHGGWWLKFRQGDVPYHFYLGRSMDRAKESLSRVQRFEGENAYFHDGRVIPFWTFARYSRS